MDIADLSVIERLKLMSEYRQARESQKLLRMWTLLGLPVPDEVADQAASQHPEAGSDQEVLQEFLKQCTRPKPGAWVQSSKLYDRFMEFEPTSNLGWSQKHFSMAMRRAGFKRKQSSVMWWQGIELLPKG